MHFTLHSGSPILQNRTIEQKILEAGLLCVKKQLENKTV